MNPLRIMVREKQFKTITETIPHRLSNSEFELRINPKGKTNQPHVSISLWLLEGSTLNQTVPLQAELTITQPARKLKQKGASSEFKTMTKKTKPMIVYQSLGIMDLPDDKDGKTTQSVAVAHFPWVISHRNLLNTNIIKAPFVELKLAIRQLFPEH